MRIAFHESNINQIDNILKELIKIQVIVIVNITNYCIKVEILIFRFVIQEIVHFLTEHANVVLFFYIKTYLLDKL